MQVIRLEDLQKESNRQLRNMSIAFFLVIALSSALVLRNGVDYISLAAVSVPPLLILAGYFMGHLVLRNNLKKGIRQ